MDFLNNKWVFTTYIMISNCSEKETYCAMVVVNFHMNFILSGLFLRKPTNFEACQIHLLQVQIFFNEFLNNNKTK